MLNSPMYKKPYVQKVMYYFNKDTSVNVQQQTFAGSLVQWETRPRLISDIVGLNLSPSLSDKLVFTCPCLVAYDHRRYFCQI